MNTLIVTTQRMEYHCQPDDAERIKNEYLASGDIVAISDGTNFIFESHPDTCIFCCELKIDCICDQA
jgi:hypothetical protein